jgi:glycerophosphoryl diester phosphodiesterase
VLPELYAHRLGRAYGPDSSLAALQGALAGPLDGLETDVCLTADGGLVLLHDPLLALNTTLEGWAHQRTGAEIRSSYIRDALGQPTAEHPLELEDLLAAVPPEIVLQLEVKAHADRDLAVRTAEAICGRLRREPTRHRIEVISFHSDACALAAARGFRSRLVVWADYAPEALATWAVGRGIAGVSVEHFLLNERLVGILRLAGLSINTGTVNRVELLARVAELGPDGVCTDRPHELRAESVKPAMAAATVEEGGPVGDELAAIA